MAEGIIAWALVVLSIYYSDTALMIAAGLFAIACNINRFHDKKEK